MCWLNSKLWTELIHIMRACVFALVYAVTFERNVCLHQSGSIMSIHNGGRANVHDVHYKARRCLASCLS
jgi:hypothetical protein|eukprot:COSAG06_NODE_104_length_23856_cov_6.259629_10_plen_69_part_00